VTNSVADSGTVEIVPPPEFHERVLTLEAPGGVPVQVSLVVPTITAPGESFDVKVAVIDANGLPVMRCPHDVALRLPEGKSAFAVLRFPDNAPVVCTVRGAALETPGLYRFEAEMDGTVFYSNPTYCTDEAAARIYWGDPHVHTVLSACHADTCRSLNFCYVAARYLSGLDWVAAADHVSNGRCEFARWKDQCLTCNAYNDPPAFVTLNAYEASLQGGCGGDTNVYLRQPIDMFVDEYEDGNVKTLCEKLCDLIDEEVFFVVPHHTTRTGKHGEIPDAIYPGPDRMPVVEIHSKWGTSEYRGNPNPLKKVHPGPSYVVDLLNQGLRLGFVGGTDTHTTMPAGGGIGPEHIDRLPGMTAVHADALTRENIFHGIRQRNCYATSLERIYLDVRIADAAPGQAIAWKDIQQPRTIYATVAGQSDIERIDIVRNGATIQTTSPGTWQHRIDLTDTENLDPHALVSDHLGRFVYYYVRVTCASGAQAWASPVWLLLD